MADETIVAPTVNVGKDNKLSQAQIKIAKKIHDAAVEADLDPDFALAIAWQENRFKPIGKSEAGAIGPMQIMPKTAEGYGVSSKDLSDPDTNIKLGVHILKTRYDANEGDKLNTAIDYNAGPSVTQKFLKSNRDLNKLPDETKDYVANINNHHPLTADDKIDFSVINTAKADEKNPFDYDLNASKSNKGFENIFGDTEELPPHLANEIQSSPKNENVLEKVAKEAYESPTEAGFVTAPFASGAQYSINKDIKNVENLRRQATINKEILDEQFKAQQAEKTTPAEMTSGDKWSAKTVGAQGPGGESTTEAARNYRIQQRLQTGQDVENPLWQTNRSGIILPRGEQQEIDMENIRRAQEEIEKKPTVADIARRARAPLEAIGGSKFGRSSLLTGAANIGAGYYIDEAREREQSGDLLGASISHVKALGAGMTAIPTVPHPLSRLMRGVGIGTTLGGQGLDILKEKLFPYESVVKKQPAQIKKADGGYIPLSLKHVHFHRAKKQG